MIAMRRNCLEPNELRQVLDGELSQEQFDSAISHLDHCETCRTAAETLEGSLRALGGDSEAEIDGSAALQNETACQVALQNLLSSPPASKQGSSSPPPPFETLGPYRLLELIGSGGMGAVYRAEHQRLKRQCAIKLLPPDRVTQTGWLERFDREMTTIASLEHPHIVHATDAGHESGWHYLVMEHLDGLDIGRVASRMGQLDVADACEIVRQAALGLAHIHDSGLVHRDIKPSNLMLTRSGTVKLLDLGLVLDGDDPLSKDDRLTTVGHVMGTMPYMAPEQLADSRDVRPQSDIYSLGATLYRLIAGHPPHRSGRGLAAQVLAITSKDAKRLDSVREDVDRETVEFVAQMLARDPAKRPASATEVARRLESLAKTSRLKRLIRDALRKPDDENLPQTGLLPSIGNGGNANHRSGIKRWLIGLSAAAFLFAAAMVIKIQTDRGDLVIHSEQDGLTVVIKQGDEVVERLQIDSDNENRKTLHKGTYSVEIEGGGPALALSDEVVTIGRGSTSDLDVIRRAVSEDRSSDDVAVTGPGPGVVAGARQPGGTTRPSTTSEMGGDYMMSSSEVQNANSTSHWINVIETATDVETVGEALFSGLDALQNARSSGINTQKDKAATIRALFRRAREFGGLSSKLPPLAGVTPDDDLSSEHFVWYLTQAFAESEIAPWYEASADELIEGNAKSRAAVIYCLDHHLDRVRTGMMSGMGGMGGMSGMGGGGFGIGTTISKFTGSRLLRCCVSLGSTDAWSDLPEPQRSTAASMARNIAMMLPSVTDHMSIDPYSLPELIDSIREVPENERSDTERAILEQADGSTKNSGSAYDGGSASPDSDMYAETYEVEVSQTQPTSQPATETETLYQGRGLSSWMQSLNRERDIESLAEAMKAVETLSRESDADRRLAAASETLSVARRLGGIVAGGNEIPSHQFMEHFLQTFPRYFPNPGIEAIQKELTDGNNNSQVASAWTLHNYFFRDATGYTTISSSSRSADTWARNLQKGQAERAQLEQLVVQLLDYSDSIATSNADDEFGTTSESFARQQAITMAGDSALWIAMALDQPIAEHGRLKQYVIEQVKSVEEYSNGEGLGFAANFGQKRLNEQVLLAAIEVAEAEKQFGTRERWTFFAEYLLSQAEQQQQMHQQLSKQYLVAFERLKQAAPQALLDVFVQSWNSPPDPMGSRDKWFALVIPFYAEAFKPAEEAASLLRQVRHRFADEKLQTIVSDAIETAEKRFDAAAGEPAE